MYPLKISQLHCVSKSSHRLTVCNFVKSWLISKNFFLPLESVWNLLQNPYDTTQLTLGMLLHYLGKLKLQIFCRCGRKRKQVAFSIASTFYIHPQIWIFSVFQIANLSPYWLQIKIFHVTVLLLFTFAINSWHRKFVTADNTAVFINNQHGI